MWIDVQVVGSVLTHSTHEFPYPFWPHPLYVNTYNQEINVNIFHADCLIDRVIDRLISWDDATSNKCWYFVIWLLVVDIKSFQTIKSSNNILQRRFSTLLSNNELCQVWGSLQHRNSIILDKDTCTGVRRIILKPHCIMAVQLIKLSKLRKWQWQLERDVKSETRLVAVKCANRSCAIRRCEKF